MKYLYKFSGGFNKMINGFAMLLLLVMVLVIIYQVFTRYFFSYTATWTTVMSLVFLVWFGFIGVVIGQREHAHIGIEMVYKKLGNIGQKICDIIISLLFIGVGLLFIIDGLKFVQLTSHSTLPGMDLPSSVMYSCIPVTGAIMLLYGISQLIRDVKGESSDIKEEG